MKIGITGSTGQLGRIAIEKLKEKAGGDELIALARSLDKAKDLGVSAREADYDKPETLGPALAGVDKLLLISGSELGKRYAQHKNVIDAAKEAGVGHIVYTSLLHADTSPISLAEEHRKTEAELKASGIPFTILRNGWYIENHTPSIPIAIANGALIGSAGEGKFASATREDFAEAAAAVLTGDGHDGKIYELGGDEAYTLADFAAEISKQSGKEIPYNNLPVAEYSAILEKAGFPKELASAFARWDADAAKGALFDESRQLSELIGRPTTSMAEAVAAFLKQS